MQGAMEAKLPATYLSLLTELPCYEAPKSGMRLLGAYMFLVAWVPVMGFAEWLTKANVATDGHRSWARQTVRLILMVMWFDHDFIHSEIWGRGDGLDQGSELGVMEKGHCITYL